MDSRSRQGFLGLQFEHLVSGVSGRSIVLDTAAGRFILTRHDNVVTCSCELYDLEQREALSRRGAVEDVFMISPKLPAKEFGTWLDRLLVEDLGMGSNGDVEVLFLEALAS